MADRFLGVALRLEADRAALGAALVARLARGLGSQRGGAADDYTGQALTIGVVAVGVVGGLVALAGAISGVLGKVVTRLNGLGG